LPQMTRLRIFPIEVLCVAHVRTCQCARKRIVFLRYRNKVDMVRHQAIGEYLEAVFFPILLQEAEIGLPVFVLQENIHPSIAPLGDVVRNLGDVVRNARGYNSGYSRHEPNDNSESAAQSSKKWGLSLFYLSFVSSGAFALHIDLM